MGTGFSVICSSKRSVIIANSLRSVRREPEQLETHKSLPDLISVSRKLHPCESRDSGIVENEILHYQNGLNRPEHEVEHVNEEPNQDNQSNELSYHDANAKPSRPHSCRLGNRRASQNKRNDHKVQEDRIVKLLRLTRKSSDGAFPPYSDDENIEREDSFYGPNDPDDNAKAGSKRKKARAKSCKSEGRQSTKIISDLDLSSGAEDMSDSDVWEIPDETDFRRKKGSGSRKGWVMQEDGFDQDSSGSGTPTPRSSQCIDYYRIVSDSYRRYDTNIAKKASEMSISSIILTPVDGLCNTNRSNFSSNTECSNVDTTNSLPNHLQRKMDDLVSAFLDALHDRHKKGKLTQKEYENIMKTLRHQLVHFVVSCIINDVTPRIEVQGNTKSMFSDNPWTVKIELKEADEEILQTSEKQLAKKLAKKGNKITKEDIACLLGDHLRTIEQLQHVRDSGKMHKSQFDEDDKFRLASAPESRINGVVTNQKRKKLPGSAPTKNAKLVVNVKPSQPKTISVESKGSSFTSVSSDARTLCSAEEYDIDSDNTIENCSDSEMSQKSASVGNTPEPDMSVQESKLSAELTQIMWTRMWHLSEDDICEMFWETRETIVQSFNQNCSVAIKTHAYIPLNAPRCSQIRDLSSLNNMTPAQLSKSLSKVQQGSSNSEDVSMKELHGDGGTLSLDTEKDLRRQDRTFVNSVRNRCRQDEIAKKALGDLVLGHMRKTVKTRVQAIKVNPAPLSRTRSLNDAVIEDCSSTSTSAKSTLSRKSEPDMRYWGSNGNENLWDSTEKPERVQSARKNVQRATTGKRRTGTTQVHGLSHMEPLSEGKEEHNMPKVDESECKINVKSRPDSGIAVSMSSGSYSSYSSSDATKETDDIDEACVTESIEMLDRVEKINPDSHSDMKSLAAAITKGLTSQPLKAHALYCWLGSVGLAKYTRSNKKQSTPSAKLRQLVEKKTTHAHFFQELCRAAGIKCERIEGFVKSKDYLPGNTVQSQKFAHTWNAVNLDGHFRLVDPYYGARREKFFIDHYFMTSPDAFVLSHFPKEKKWLLMNQAISVDDFENTVKTWPAMFHFNIRPLSMKSVIRTYDGKLSITVLLQNVAVIPQLEYAGPGPELQSDTLADNIDEEIRDIENAETFHITLPQEGNYYFTLLAHVLEDELDIPVFQYRIEYTDELL